MPLLVGADQKHRWLRAHATANSNNKNMYGWLFGCWNRGVVTHHTVRLVRAMVLVFIDGVVHVSYMASASQGIEITNRPTCRLVSCGMPPSVLTAIVVTSRDVLTCTCDEGTTDGRMSCADGGSLSSVSTCSVALVRDATTGESSGNCHHLGSGFPLDGGLCSSMAPLDVVFFDQVDEKTSE